MNAKELINKTEEFNEDLEFFIEGLNEKDINIYKKKLGEILR